MKLVKIEYDSGPVLLLELTRRNLETLLAKLDDPHSVRTLVCGDGSWIVRAVENEMHYSDRPPGAVIIGGVLQ